MTCRHCGVELVNASPNSSIEYYTHPGGACLKQTFVLGSEDFTLEEVRALKRVAQAQLEMEVRRGRNG